MKVLHITPTYFPNIGGIEAVIRNTSRGLQKAGNEVAIAHIEPGLTREDCMLEGLRVHRIPLHGHRLFGVAPALRDIAAQYDILHVHDPQLMAITGSVLAFAKDKPRVLSSHGFYGHTSQLSGFKALHEKLVFGRLLGAYHSVLAASKTDLSHAQKFTKNATLFENGIDASAFAPAAEQTSRDLRRWLYWGRISQNKRPDLLVDLVHALRAKGEDIQLTIAGRPFDDMQARLHERRAALEMEDHVRILPALDDETLLAEIKKAGVFVSASEYEGFGLTFIEAMSGGLGIVSQDILPMSEFARASNAGVAIDFQNTEQAAQTLQSFLASDPVENAQRAAQFALTYDWSAKIPVLEAHYKAAIKAQ